MDYSNRQIRKKQLTKISLKNAFISLVLENNNVDCITIREITDKADFNRGTFYTHYQDKIDLLEDLYEDAMKGIHQSIKTQLIKGDESLFEEGMPAVEHMFNYIKKNNLLFKALDLMKDHPDLYQRLEQFLWHLFTEEFQIERDTATSETEYEILLSFEINAILGVLKHWIRKDFLYSPDFMTEQLKSYYTHRVIGMKSKKNAS